MSDSHFATPFMEEINTWIEKLSTVHEVLMYWILLQNNLFNMRNIFHDTLIQKQFPDAYKQLCLINKQYAKILNDIKVKPAIFDQCLSYGRLQEISILLNSLEKCRSSLEDYVRLGKKQCPRFYLLSDEELFPILNVTQIENIQTVLPKIFHNVSSLTTSFIEVNLNEKYVTGMVSLVGEMISFRNQIKLIKSTPIWMSSVVQEMKKTIKYIIKMSIYNYASVKQSCSDWISKHAGVCTLVACNVWWTAEVEYSLMQVNEGNLKAMKSLMDKLNNRLDELLLEIRNPSNKMNRIKFINIFLLLFHEKNVVEKLINESVLSKDDFDWNCQLRFYWVKISGTLKIKQCIGITKIIF
ncbi:dynein axonemal heavy chain 10-like [Halyomorpha halys]|uniref:dynein axonemal heavy chain 10-like n=1 Tax=Halyomorpha halys TaxID=286706 RepID=UPI0034D28E1F